MVGFIIEKGSIEDVLLQNFKPYFKPENVEMACAMAFKAVKDLAPVLNRMLAEEREACAKIADEALTSDEPDPIWGAASAATAGSIARRIRARGSTVGEDGSETKGTQS